MLSLLVHLLLSIITSSSLATPLTTPSTNRVLSRPLLLNPSKNTTTILPSKPLNLLFPPAEPINCIHKPRLRPVNAIICAPILALLIHNTPESLIHKQYTAPVTVFGASPCHIELRNSEKGGRISITEEQIGNAALAVLQKCEEVMGAGWGQFESQSGCWLFLAAFKYLFLIPKAANVGNVDISAINTSNGEVLAADMSNDGILMSKTEKAEKTA
ncbi:MAG: hypothetical protein LQ337_001829 [Flavoplaca oasis]|nr:MAG: hypothetical protein LQ337_001829 [Flavoplaca oasis]